MNIQWNKLKSKNESEEYINLKNRYKYVRDTIDDFGYIMTNSNLKKVGQVYVGICPFPSHNEKTGSFTVFPRGYVKNGIVQDYTSFYCFGCGEGGDVIKFKQLLEGLPDKESACKVLEKEHDIDVNLDSIRQTILKESLASVKNSTLRQLSFKDVNLICSKICREYLNGLKYTIKSKDIIDEEFIKVQDFYRYFDNEISEMTMEESKNLISITEEFINMRITELENNFKDAE